MTQAIAIADLPAYLASMADELERAPLTDVLKSCTTLIDQAVEKNFLAGGSPLGPWPPHSPATVARYGPHPLLILSGDMMAAATREGARGHVQELTDRAATVGIDGEEIVYALAQNYGHAAKNIPARPFMVIDDSVGDACEVVIADAAATLVGAV